ncbi:MAG: hypothetical protein CMI63_06715 [Parvularcula sp.]|nr:hypothetical protein [Parvularcula sp.]
MSGVPVLPALLTEKEAAARLRIHLATLQRIRRRGEIRFKRVGRSIRYREDWLAEYVERDSCPEMTNPVSSENTGFHSAQVRKIGIAPGTSGLHPAIDAQSAKALALQTLRKPS